MTQPDEVPYRGPDEWGFEECGRPYVPTPDETIEEFPTLHEKRGVSSEGSELIWPTPEGSGEFL